MKNILKVLIFICWLFSNLIVFSAVVYLAWSINGDSYNTYSIAAMMIIWVFGQILYVNFPSNTQNDTRKQQGQ